MTRILKNLAFTGIVIMVAFSTASCRQPTRLVVFPYEAKPRNAEALYGSDSNPQSVHKAAGKTNPKAGTYDFEQEVLKDN